MAAAMIWAWVVEALHAGVNQPLAELVEVENAGDQNDEAEKIEKDDAADQPLRGKAVQKAVAAFGGQVVILNLLALVAFAAFKGLGCRGLVKHFAPSRGGKFYCSLKR